MFRQDSLCTTFMSALFGRYLPKFLTTYIGTALRSYMLINFDEIEINPSKLEQKEKLKANQESLLEITKILIDSVMNNIQCLNK